MFYLNWQTEINLKLFESRLLQDGGGHGRRSDAVLLPRDERRLGRRERPRLRRRAVERHRPHLRPGTGFANYF